MADETKEIIHQHYANATAAIAAMNDQNWAYEEAANRIIVMDGATPVYFETAARLIAGGSFIVNQTASPQSGGFSVSGNGLIGGTFTLTGIQTNSAEIAAGASLAMRRTIDSGYLAVSGGNAINSGANLVMNGGSHASGANDWSFRAGATDKLVWDDSASLLTLSGGISATTGSFSSTLAVAGNLTLSTLSSGRIPVVSTAGLITQDNLYWDATNDRLGIGAGASSPLEALHVSPTNIAGTNIIRLTNADNTNSLSHALVLIETGGASAGDSFIRFSNTVTGWAAGIDNSDSDAFVISGGASLGTNNCLRIAAGGSVTIPGTLGVTGASTLAALSATTGAFSGDVTLSGETAERVLFTDAYKVASTGGLRWDEANQKLGIGYSPLYDLTIAKAATNDELRMHVLNQGTGGAESTTLYLGKAATGTNDVKIVITNNTTTYAIGLDDSASDAFVLSLGGTLGTSNVMSISTAGAVTFNYGVVLVSTLYLFGTTTFDGTVCFTDTETAGAGGTNWTNETDIDVSGANSAEITPTADSQTYKFTNPTSGQILTVTNAHASYNIYIDLTDGSGTATQYINAGRMCLFRYNGTRWYSTY